MKISNFKSREKQRVEAFKVLPEDIESEIEEMNEFKKLLKKNTQSATCIYVPQKEPA